MPRDVCLNDEEARVLAPPEAAGFVKAFRALSGSDPLPGALLTYDAVNMLLTAVEQGMDGLQGPTRQSVMAKLSSMHDYPGLSSTISFDKTGAASQPKVYFYRITGQRFPGEKQEIPN